MEVHIGHPISVFKRTALAQNNTPKSTAKKMIQVAEAIVRTAGLYLLPRYSGIVYIPPLQKYGIKINAASKRAGMDPIQSKLPTAIP